ncbi:MAG: Sulfur carrier protein FdhD [Chloroflexi bacterium]|nr:Sulfur carrier protein FdhD [Chloroflexota bacterium]
MGKSGAVDIRWHQYRATWEAVDGEIIEESLITIYVNGIEIAALMGTPLHLDWLALGFLKNEGLIETPKVVESLWVTQDRCCVDVWLSHEVQKPKRVIITSGCGGGLTFDDPSLGIEPIRSSLRVEPEQILDMFNSLQSSESLYARARGVHASGLMDAEEDQLLAVAEDVGRHNSIDKVHGACLQAGIETRGRVLLTTGRISSEMLRKGAVMGCPIVASRTSPTSLSMEMAQAWNITLVGYVRGGGMQVYTHPERLGYKSET